MIHTYPQLLWVKAQLFGEKFPGKIYGLFFEIITKGKIAQHFEKGVVSGGISYIFQVVVFTTGAHTGLGRGSALVRTTFLAHEHLFELHHAGVDKEQGGIVVGYQRGACHPGMAFVFEIV